MDRFEEDAKGEDDECGERRCDKLRKKETTARGDGLSSGVREESGDCGCVWVCADFGKSSWDWDWDWD